MKFLRTIPRPPQIQSSILQKGGSFTVPAINAFQWDSYYRVPFELFAAVRSSKVSTSVKQILPRSIATSDSRRLKKDWWNKRHALFLSGALSGPLIKNCQRDRFQGEIVKNTTKWYGTESRTIHDDVVNMFSERQWIARSSLTAEERNDCSQNWSAYLATSDRRYLLSRQ